MNPKQMIAIVQEYIYKRTKQHVKISSLQIMTNPDQQQKLIQAVEIAQNYYNGTKIII